jgi:diguanylate cyclase (GGDEF)-like protein/PAS domain S-box-containing protein
MSVNPTMERALGYMADDLLGRSYTTIFPAEEAGKVADHVVRAASALGHQSTTKVLHDNGMKLELLIQSFPVVVASEVGSVIIIAYDITTEKRAFGRVRKLERENRLLIENIRDMFIVHDPEGHLTYVNPSFSQVTGYSQEEARRLRIAEIIHPDDRAMVDATCGKCLRAEAEPERNEFRLIGKAGQTIHVECNISLVEEDDEIIGLQTILRDIGQRKVRERELERLAFHDPLTQLANRALFLDRLKHATAALQRKGGGVVAVLFLDLDGFKEVNDTLGHEAGDRLLMETARRLESCVRPGDTVARLGGDEFVLLLESVSDQSEAVRIAERVAAALREPFLLDGEEAVVSSSIGIEVATSPGIDAEELLSRADAAMYEAKNAGKARYRLLESRAR